MIRIIKDTVFTVRCSVCLTEYKHTGPYGQCPKCHNAPME